MARPRGDYYKRFAEMSERVESGCIEWRAQVKRDGYGRFVYQAKQMSAHRAAYLMFKGEIPADLLVLHECDNRICVNPEHLYVGTHKDNSQDMVRRGRNWGRRKSGDKTVAAILRLSSAGWTQERIAKKFRIDQTTVSRIVGGRNMYSRKIINSGDT